MNPRLVWLGIAAFAVALAFVLPARWIAGALPENSRCQTWKGTLWNGECLQLMLPPQAGQPPLQVESLRWKLHPLALLRLALNAEIQVRTSQGSGSGRIELGRGGRVAATQVNATAAFDRRLATMLAAGWTGQLDARDMTLRMRDNHLLALSGELALRDFSDGRGGALGSYRLVFPAAEAPPFAGTLQDDGGPLQLTATLTIAANRKWTLDGRIMPRADAPPALRRRLEYLGAPDAGGRYPLSMEGSFR